MPFIKYDVTKDKFLESTDNEKIIRKSGIKKRKIMYAGHLDSFIYKYYSDLLNKSYTEYCKQYGIDEVTTAYRDNKKQLSNIDFAAEVIDYIANQKACTIFIGDFTNFFDKLTHQLLKEKIQKVLKTEYLSKDWYNIFKSMTKYGYYEKEVLIKKFGTDKQLRNEKKYSYFESLKEFRKFQKIQKVSSHSDPYGIPQGSPISGVFANVYCVDYDVAMKDIADRYEGIYRRYSDDFILVIPKVLSENEMYKLKNQMLQLAVDNNLILQDTKTSISKCIDKEIIEYETEKKSVIDYLGFVFDGQTVKMRAKSPHKFYGKAYKLIRKAKKIQKRKNLNKIPYRRQIYKLYTDEGSTKKKSSPYGNFIAYAKRAQKKFDDISKKTDNQMMNQIVNRKSKIFKKMYS